MAVLLVHTEGPLGYWSRVTARLAALGVEVVAATSYRPDEHLEQLVAHGVESIELLDVREMFAPEAVAAAGAAWAPPPRGPAFQVDAERSMEDFLTITDRGAFFPVSVRYRMRLYRQIVRYWDGYLEARPEIGAVFFTDVPHHGWDLVLYEVARIRGLRVPSICATAINDRIFFREDFRTPPSPPPGFAEGIPTEQLLEGLSPEAREALRGESQVIAHGRSLIDQPQDRFEVPADAARGKRAPSGLRAVLEVLGRGGRTILQDLFASEFDFATSINGIRSRLVRKLLRQVQRLRFRGLRQALYPRLQMPPAGKPYAVFMMHVQPERTTAPEAGRFVDQVLAVETLASSLPADWTLAVREHPRQLEADAYNYIQTFHFRTPADYAALARIPRVVLTPPEQSVDGLLAGASLISTATGSAGWEGLLLGKPVVCFGYPWYSGCASCHRGDLPGGVAAGVEAALGSEVAATVGRDVVAYLAWLEDRLIRGTHSDIVTQNLRTPIEDLVEGMAEGIRDSLQPSPRG